MTRYFFDFHDAATKVPDRVGMELDTPELARLYAMECLGQALTDRTASNGSFAVEIRDDERSVATVTATIETNVK